MVSCLYSTAVHFPACFYRRHPATTCFSVLFFTEFPLVKKNPTKKTQPKPLSQNLLRSVKCFPSTLPCPSQVCRTTYSQEHCLIWFIQLANTITWSILGCLADLDRHRLENSQKQLHQQIQWSSGICQKRVMSRESWKENEQEVTAPSAHQAEFHLWDPPSGMVNLLRPGKV